MSKKQSKNFITCQAGEENDPFNSLFMNDKDRMAKLSRSYKNVDIAKAFATYYGFELSDEVKKQKQVECVTGLELGKIYTGTVKEISKTSIEFSFPGAKEFIIMCKESFATCYDALQNYLITHDNMLLFEVREKKKDVYYVSVINAYYKIWMNMIENAIEYEEPIDVHIDELVNGGYVGSTSITPLVELTGKPYTSRIFIPGSHIVLNIEHDFNKWIGQDVQIIPQKFVEYKKDFRNGVIENCLVGSRKRVLQIIGNENIYNLYNAFENAKKLADMANKTEIELDVYKGTVTGIINSSGKTGIFIEINDMYITGLMPVESFDLLDYHPGDEVNVKVKEFEVKNDREPFIFAKRGGNRRGPILKTNVRVVFEKA